MPSKNSRILKNVVWKLIEKIECSCIMSIMTSLASEFIRHTLQRTYMCVISSHILPGFFMSLWEITISSWPRAWARIVWRTEYMRRKSIRVYARRQFTYYNTYYHGIGSRTDEYRWMVCVFCIDIICWHHDLLYVIFYVFSSWHLIVISVIIPFRVASCRA